MLTVEQQGLLTEGFGLGLRDDINARRLTLSRKEVYAFRRSMKVSAKDLLENRLNTWVAMIRDAESLDSISKMYKVKPSSIRQMLWREKQFHFRKVKGDIRAAGIAKLKRGMAEDKIKLLGLESIEKICPK